MPTCYVCNEYYYDPKIDDPYKSLRLDVTLEELEKQLEAIPLEDFTKFDCGNVERHRKAAVEDKFWGEYYEHPEIPDNSVDVDLDAHLEWLFDWHKRFQEELGAL